MTPEQQQSIVLVLQQIVRNDETRFDHHQARRWDGRRPGEEGSGSIWLTPKDLAKRALRLLGAAIPDP